MRLRAANRQAAARRGDAALLAVRIVAVTMVVVMLGWATLGLLDSTPPAMPAWLWAVAVLIAPAATVVAWDPATRVDDLVWTIFVAAVFLGMGGAGWGSWAAPVIGGLTAISLLFLPKADRPASRRR